MSFIDIIIQSETNPDLLYYNKHEKLTSKLDNYSIKMGFGLHFGWAIEGAIGSSFKINASYLSSNVDMSARLEGATKIYGCMILFTGEVYDMFITKNILQKCRHLDSVLMKGCFKPVRLYTVDININNLVPKEEVVRPSQTQLDSIKQDIRDNL